MNLNEQKRSLVFYISKGIKSSEFQSVSATKFNGNFYNHREIFTEPYY